MMLRILVCWMLAASAFADSCKGGEGKQVYWGDLHAHSSYSLDAWGFGTKLTPPEMYRFARGETVTLATGQQAKISRPLDFLAITDHAEWFDLMYLCTDPVGIDDAYCGLMNSKNTPETGIEVFRGYVVPTITLAEPVPTAICEGDPARCDAAWRSQWQRVQDHANDANQPCEFTTFIAYEWSATPDFSHTHRNVVFSSDKVTPEAYDYMRYPRPFDLWRQLESNCLKEEGCDVLAIPHNTNMSDGNSFDVETESPDEHALRARYERLIEIHQEKGNSECLPAFGQADEDDCDFEIMLMDHSRPQTVADYSKEGWQKMRSGYARHLLSRGIAAFAGEAAINPLQMGIIGSTDNHGGIPGLVEESEWPGSVFGIGSLERSMSRLHWNPGGVTGVWAAENTRESIFSALHRREVYGTSGPRIKLRFDASRETLSCENNHQADSKPMGSEFARSADSLSFRTLAEADRAPLVRIDFVSARVVDGDVVETVTPLWEDSSGSMSVCVAAVSNPLENVQAAYWYVRAIEAPTERWSSVMCRAEGRCDEFPGALRSVQERAWSSPIWYLP